MGQRIFQYVGILVIRGGEPIFFLISGLTILILWFRKHLMETISLSFDIPKNKKMDGGQVSELRQEMSLQLDKDLRDASVGKWSGGLQSLGGIKIFLAINSCREALPVIKGTLKNHWLLPKMKIRRLR